MVEPSKGTQIDALTNAINQADVDGFNATVDHLHYADLASVFVNLDESGRIFFTEQIQVDRFPNILAELPDTLIEETLERFESDKQKKILGKLIDDDRADVLQDVTSEARQRYLALLKPDQMDATRSLMRYGEETAGGRMTTHVARITKKMTVKEVLDILRKDKDSVETLARIYVVNDQGKLLGKVRLRELAFNKWDTPIEKIMQGVDMSILASADQEKAAQIFTKYDMTVLPVVDEQYHLLGVITHDDVFDIIEQESTEDIEKMSGIAGERSEETYLNTSVLTHFKRRFPWLLILALLAIVSGYVMLRFESVLDSVFLLALYLPMVVAAGGNTGGQTAVSVIRAMSLGEIKGDSTIQVLTKELFLGLLLGALLGMCVGLFTLFILPFFQPIKPDSLSYGNFALAISVALSAQIVTSALCGAVLPLGARLIRLDPAVVAAPAITTLVDISGMIIYFTVARNILPI